VADELPAGFRPLEEEPPAGFRPLEEVAPLDDWTPLREAYTAKQQAMAAGKPEEVAAADARIQDFTRKMQEAENRRQVEALGPLQKFGVGVGKGLENVWEHVKEFAPEVLPIGHPGSGFEPEERAARAASRQAVEQQMAPLQGTLPGFLGTTTGEAIGTAPIAAATAPAGPVLGGTLAGAGIGGLMAQPGERVPQAILGGALGGLLGAGQKATEAFARPGFEISPAAKRLRELKVEGMTGGHLSPQSTVAQIEQVAESGPYGAVIRNRRQVLPLNLQQRELQEAYPPGFQSKLPPGASVFDQLRELRGEFRNRYNQLLDTQPVPKNQIQSDLMKHAYGPTKFSLTPSQRKLAVDIITDQAAQLDDNNSMRTLASIKSGLQEEERSLARTDPRLAKHIGDAVKIADSHIESAMKADVNPEAYAQYKELGKAYRNFTVLNKAVPPRAMATNMVLTPDAVSRSLYRNMTPSQYARGEGGVLRELAEAGKQVLSERPGTKTGASLNLMSSIPNIGPLQMGPWLLGQTAKFTTAHPELLLGETLPQRVLQKTLANPVVGGVVGQEARVGALELARRLAAQAEAEKKAKEEQQGFRSLPITLGGP